MIKDFFLLIFSHFSFSFFCLAALIAAVDSWQKEHKWISPSLWFKWLAILVFGLTGIYGFFMHTFMHEMVAKAYGLKPSGFQIELGLANLGFGLLGILCYKKDFSFRKATTIAAVIYWFGSWIVQSLKMLEAKKFTLAYSLSWYAMDFIVPTLLVVFLLLSSKESSRKKTLWFR